MLTSGQIEAEHPRWRVWKADSSTWWASVRENLTPSQERRGLKPYISAMTAEGLLPQLEQQDLAAAALMPVVDTPTDEAALTPKPVVLRAWGFTKADLEHARAKAARAPQRHGWTVVEVEEAQQPDCPIPRRDPAAMTDGAGYHWAWAVYPIAEAAAS